jgi:hypothetical protein
LVKRLLGIYCAVIFAIAFAPVSSSRADSPVWPESITLPTGSPSAKSEYEIELALTSALQENQLAPDITPALKSADARSVIYSDNCMEQRAQTLRYPCLYGDPNGQDTMWLIGDSHAAQWFYAVNNFAKSHDYRLVVHTKSSCQPQVNSHNKWDFKECADFNNWLLRSIKKAKPDVLVVGLYSGILKLIEPNVFHRLASLSSSAGNTYLIGDTPKRSKYPPTCLRQNKLNVRFCDTPESKAFDARVTNDTKNWAKQNGAKYIDVKNWFCVKKICPATVGNLMLFRDFTHITGIAATWYSQVLAKELASPNGR